MAKFYHIDRVGRLNRGDKIELTCYNDVSPEFLQRHVDSLFPEGISSHGEIYFLRNEMQAKGVSPIIELVFEYVRRSNYSHLPSRFQSFFAFGSPKDAINFSKKYGNSKGTLWEVECDDARSFKADMNILNLRDSLLALSYRASCYWKGLPDPSGVTPTWEFLLKPPVEIVRKINQL